jgi:hypothetical protein
LAGHLPGLPDGFLAEGDACTATLPSIPARSERPVGSKLELSGSLAARVIEARTPAFDALFRELDWLYNPS